MCYALQALQDPRVETAEDSDLDELSGEEISAILSRGISLVPVATKKGCSWLKHIAEKDEPLALFEAQTEVRNFLIKALQNSMGLVTCIALPHYFWFVWRRQAAVLQSMRLLQMALLGQLWSIYSWKEVGKLKRNL